MRQDILSKLDNYFDTKKRSKHNLLWISFGYCIYCLHALL